MKMSSNGVRLEVNDVRDGRVVVDSGAYKITFEEGPDGEAQITSAFFVSDGSYIDKEDIPYEYARPARIRAKVVFRDHQGRRARKEAKRKKERKEPSQLTFPFN